MLTLDRKRAKAPVRASRAERLYTKQLSGLARQVGAIIGEFPPGDIETLPTLEQMLRRYAEALMPWATVAASKMIEEVNARDLAGWKAVSAEMSHEIRREILTAPTGKAMRALMEQQVTLIRSIPIEAAHRVHELTIRAREDGTRANELVGEIMRSGQVAQSRARLIARTEVARTAANLTQARAQHVGSKGYVWETSHDGDVRPSHREMAGQYVAWGNPPTLDGLTGHAGCLPNCRCWARVILPNE